MRKQETAEAHDGTSRSRKMETAANGHAQQCTFASTCVAHAPLF
jgi:hypothetical protein